MFLYFIIHKQHFLIFLSNFRHLVISVFACLYNKRSSSHLKAFNLVQLSKLAQKAGLVGTIKKSKQSTIPASVSGYNLHNRAYKMIRYKKTQNDKETRAKINTQAFYLFCHYNNHIPYAFPEFFVA